jgi:hypothetical protein
MDITGKLIMVQGMEENIKDTIHEDIFFDVKCVTELPEEIQTSRSKVYDTTERKKINNRIKALLNEKRESIIVYGISFDGVYVHELFGFSGQVSSFFKLKMIARALIYGLDTTWYVNPNGMTRGVQPPYVKFH